jgi:hypothetical protein
VNLLPVLNQNKQINSKIQFKNMMSEFAVQTVSKKMMVNLCIWHPESIKELSDALNHEKILSIWAEHEVPIELISRCPNLRQLDLYQVRLWEDKYSEGHIVNSLGCCEKLYDVKITVSQI